MLRVFIRTVAVDGSGNVYVTGYSSGTLDSQTHLGGPADLVLLKFNGAGDWQWTQRSGTGGDDLGYAGEWHGMTLLTMTFFRLD